MKYKGANFSQVRNDAIESLNSHNRKVPAIARWLYVHLNYLEHRYTGKNRDFFFHSLDQLSKDTKFSRPAILSAIKVLKNMKLIDAWQDHWVNKETGKKSEKHITVFRVL